MNSLLPPKIKEKPWWKEVLFYGAASLLALAVLCYIIFFVNIYLERQKIAEIEVRINSYGTEEQKGYEKEILAYKRKIDDFNALVQNHKISLNLFNFIERNTLPSVWFGTFDMSETANVMKLTGETDSLAILSQQVKTLEDQDGYIKHVAVLESHTNPLGKVAFTLTIILDPTIFNYTEVSLPSRGPEAANPS